MRQLNDNLKKIAKSISQLFPNFNYLKIKILFKSEKKLYKIKI